VPDRRRFTDQVAIVTGGAGGIGSAVSAALAAEGASVVVADIDAEGADRVAAEITASGDEAVAIGIAVDLADESSVEALVAATVARFGRIDILDNNAALTAADVLARDADVATMDIEVWDQMMAVNLRSQMLTCKHAVPAMIETGGGAIVNMSSGAANTSDLTRTAYSVSKAGVTAFTKHVATQYGRQGVRANCIVPGLILTDPVRAQIPPALLAGYASNLLTTFVGEPRDVADLVMFLVSPASRYITGQSISIDGGMSAHSARLPKAE
jgi:NAD(P)-dependent dehydrogenase (short-subunit alcohol dehydrogenase family)